MLRDLMMTERLSQTDLRDRPQRFFAAHRILSNWATYLGPGFGIRFTVQYSEIQRRVAFEYLVPVVPAGARATMFLPPFPRTEPYEL